MSSPISPTGHSDCTEIPRARGKSPAISSVILASFLLPPKTMSFSWKSLVNWKLTKLSMPGVPVA